MSFDSKMIVMYDVVNEILPLVAKIAFGLREILTLDVF